MCERDWKNKNKNYIFETNVAHDRKEALNENYKDVSCPTLFILLTSGRQLLDHQMIEDVIFLFTLVFLITCNFYLQYHITTLLLFELEVYNFHKKEKKYF